MALIVRLPDGRTLRFSRSFHIGREHGCEVELSDAQVSRRHAEVSLAGDEWVVSDLQSSNGLFVDGRRVERARIGDGAAITLGADGPTLQLELEGAAPVVASGRPDPAGGSSVEEYAQRYFGSTEDDDAGERTQMIRLAFEQVQQRQKRTHRLTIAAVALVALAAGGYALYAHIVLSRETARWERFFYQIKAQDVVIAGLEQSLKDVNSPAQQQVRKYMEQRRQMQSDYEGFVANLYDRKLSEKEKLILRVTRLFGECDIAAPPDYIGEVTRYIRNWQSTGRFANDLKRAQDHGYAPRIVQALAAEGLPAQYFYLAMQESNFDPQAVGPPTRFGYAKGMWQFIPDTGQQYGLRTGPLFRQPAVDLADERMDWQKATPAAAKYIKTIYSTDAQASGLLVMASYNWGERRVVTRLKQMPLNPTDRNFWKLLAQYPSDVPPETYNYVFSIVSAAVIGENPRLFGFPFDNPLASLTPPQ